MSSSQWFILSLLTLLLLGGLGYTCATQPPEPPRPALTGEQLKDQARERELAFQAYHACLARNTNYCDDLIERYTDN